MTSKLKTDVLETGSGSGTIALNNQLSGMTTASLPTLTSAEMPSGSVLQVVGSSNDIYLSTSTVSWVNTGTSVTITPSSTSSKIKIDHFSGGITTGSGLSGGIRLLRDGVQIMANTRLSYSPSGATHYIGINWSFVFLDSPASTSPVVYTVQIGGEGQDIRYGDLDTLVGSAQNRNSIIATEIKG